MRLPTPEREDLKNQLKAERLKIVEYGQEKDKYWLANNLQEYRRVKRLWQDCAEQINHLHRLLYPYFPYSATCPECGSDMLPVSGSPFRMNSCVACGQMTTRY